MKIAVRYFTRSGNTEKLAKAIAEAVGTQALTTDEPLKEDVDILFLGSSVYAYGVDDNIKKFISDIDVKVGRVVNFSTAALIKSTYKQVAKLLKEKNIAFASEEFYCKGSFGPMHKGKPDADDIKAAAEFARKVVEG
ncbi:MAG: flavodoxin [Lachnospiraceae bacterium]|nr:flavodoxin [Lachnospiraceae bacterium]